MNILRTRSLDGYLVHTWCIGRLDKSTDAAEVTNLTDGFVVPGVSNSLVVLHISNCTFVQRESPSAWIRIWRMNWRSRVVLYTTDYIILLIVEKVRLFIFLEIHGILHLCMEGGEYSINVQIVIGRILGSCVGEDQQSKSGSNEQQLQIEQRTKNNFFYFKPSHSIQFSLGGWTHSP